MPRVGALEALPPVWTAVGVGVVGWGRGWFGLQEAAELP